MYNCNHLPIPTKISRQTLRTKQHYDFFAHKYNAAPENDPNALYMSIYMQQMRTLRDLFSKLA